MESGSAVVVKVPELRQWEPCPSQGQSLGWWQGWGLSPALLTLEGIWPSRKGKFLLLLRVLIGGL